MDLVIFEENKPLILQALGNGEFDYIESASEVYEADFFRFIKAKAILDNLAGTYPTPEKRKMSLYGFIYPATFQCDFMVFIPSMPFLWWFAPEGCSTLLALRQGGRLFIRTMEM